MLHMFTKICPKNGHAVIPFGGTTEQPARRDHISPDRSCPFLERSAQSCSNQGQSKSAYSSWHKVRNTEVVGQRNAVVNLEDDQKAKG